MRRLAVVWATAVGLLALGFFLSTGSSRADIDKDVQGALEKIAAALEKGDSGTAETQAKALAKKIEDLDAIMHGFKPRSKKGLGVGSKKGVVVPDGIELKLNAIARDGITKAQLKREGKNLGEAAWMTAAIAEVTIHRPGDAVKGAAKQAKWKEFSEGMRDAAKELAAAAKDDNIPGVKSAAVKVKTRCDSCHSDFRK